MGLTERPCEVVAKVDNAAVQDGFELYVSSKGFIVTDDGHRVVVQYGMNGGTRSDPADEGGTVAGSRVIFAGIAAPDAWVCFSISANAASREACGPRSQPDIVSMALPSGWITNC